MPPILEREVREAIQGSDARNQGSDARNPSPEREDSAFTPPSIAEQMAQSGPVVNPPVESTEQQSERTPLPSSPNLSDQARVAIARAWDKVAGVTGYADGGSVNVQEFLARMRREGWRMLLDQEGATFVKDGRAIDFKGGKDVTDFLKTAKKTGWFRQDQASDVRDQGSAGAETLENAPQNQPEPAREKDSRGGAENAQEAQTTDVASHELSTTPVVSQNAPSGEPQAETMDEEARRGFDVAGREVTAQLEALNRFSPGQVTAYATLIDAFYKTLAGRTGKTVDELWKRFPLDVGAGTDAEGFGQALASAPPKGWKHIKTPLEVLQVWHKTTDAKAVFWTDLQGKLAEDAPDLAGYSHSFDQSAADHIKKKHSNEKTETLRGQIPITGKDIAQIPQIVTQYDAMRRITNWNGQPLIAYAKRIGNGVTVYFEGIAGKKQNLRGVSMRRYFTPSNAETILERAVRDEINVQNEQNIPPHEGSIAPSDEELNQSAWHGSGKDFDAFSLAFMSTGEGAQAFGWGAYFAERREIGEWYRKELAKSKPRVMTNEEKTAVMMAFPVKPFDPGEISRDSFVTLLPSSNVHYKTRDGRFYREDSDADGFPYEIKITEEEYEAAYKKAEIQNERAWKEYERKYAEYEKDKAQYDELVSYMTREGKESQLYEVNIPEDEDLLDWDKPLAQQPEKVKAALEKEFSEYFQQGWMEEYSGSPAPDARKHGLSDEELNKRGFVIGIPAEKMTGEDLIHRIQAREGSPKAASLLLNKLGIPGHRYLDGQSRSAGEGSHNYVIYDEKAIEIMQKYYQEKGNDTRGSFNPSTLSIRLLENADLSTFLHESGHFFLDMYEKAMAEIPANTSITSGIAQMRGDFRTILEWAGFKGDFNAWRQQSLAEKRKVHEKFARGFEAYLREGKAPNEKMKGIFAQFREWLTSIYKRLTDLRGPLKTPRTHRENPFQQKLKL